MSKLKNWRKDKKMTQASLGSLLGVGRFTICNLERGSHFASVPLAKKIESITDGAVTVGDLVSPQAKKKAREVLGL